MLHGAAEFNLCRKGIRNMLTDRQEQTLEELVAVELSGMLSFNESSRNSLRDDVREKLVSTL